MAETPDPKESTSISGEMRAVRATLNEVHAVAHRLPPPPIVPQPRQSQFAREAGRWTPTGLAILISATVPLARIWNVNEEVKKDLKEATEIIEKQEAAIKELRESVGLLSKNHKKLRNNLVEYRLFEDASFCELGVRPSYGCPADVEYHPRPLNNKKVQPIQPRITIHPLPEEDE